MKVIDVVLIAIVATLLAGICNTLLLTWFLQNMGLHVGFVDCFPGALLIGGLMTSRTKGK